MTAIDRWPFGLYGHGMHDYLLREVEIGRRVAAAEDAEAYGFGPWWDADYDLYMAGQPAGEDGNDD